MTVSAQTEARRRAAALASAAQVSGASAAIRAAAEMAEGAIEYATVAAGSPPGTQRPFAEQLHDATVSGLSGRILIERGPTPAECAAWSNQAWQNVLRNMPSVPTN